MKPDQKILDYLTEHHVGVLTVMLADGSPHAATIHFSHKTEPFKLFFQTGKTTVKVQSLLNGEIQKAAFVVGFSEEEWITIQMRGMVKVVSDPAELENAYTVHYQKNPKAEKNKGPGVAIIEFSPTWWRYSDMKLKPKIIVEGKI